MRCKQWGKSPHERFESMRMATPHTYRPIHLYFRPKRDIHIIKTEKVDTLLHLVFAALAGGDGIVIPALTRWHRTLLHFHLFVASVAVQTAASVHRVSFYIYSFCVPLLV